MLYQHVHESKLLDIIPRINSVNEMIVHQTQSEV